MILAAGLLAATWTSSMGEEQGRMEEFLAHPSPRSKAFTSTLSFQVFFEERQCQGNLCVIQAWPSLLPAGRNDCHSEHQWGAVLYPCWRHPLSPSKQRLDSPEALWRPKSSLPLQCKKSTNVLMLYVTSRLPLRANLE